MLRFNILCLVFFSSSSFSSVPLTWTGRYGIHSEHISNYRKTNTSLSSTDSGSQYVNNATGNFSNASFQTYLFEIGPEIVVNDGVSIFGLFSTGHDRGGILGDAASIKKSNASVPQNYFGNALYQYNFDSSSQYINVKSLYAKLYTDSSTIVLGRFTDHWGMGLLVNNGEDSWDRFASTKDGIRLDFKIGNFKFAPYYAKINSSPDLTKASNTKEYGLSAEYNNIQGDMTLGIRFSRKKSNSYNQFYYSDIDDNDSDDTSVGTKYRMGKTDVKIYDFYFKKKFSNLTFSFEAPLIRGDLGNVYDSDNNTIIRSTALFSRLEYNLSENWDFLLDYGYFSGDDGKGPKFEAFYAHPNFKLSNILFRYNLFAFNDESQSIYDSYIVNAKILRFKATYTEDKWSWSLNYLFAKANETASANSTAFNHQKNRSFTATQNQDDSYGSEVDLDVKYTWNSSVKVHASLSQLFTGDYWKFTNDETKKVELKKVFAAEMGVMINF